MAHPAFGCLLGVATWAAASAAIAALLWSRYEVGLPDSLGVSAFAGLLAWVAANLLWGSLQRWRERGALATGIAGVRPADGRAILVGTLEARGAALEAPLDGAPCLAYSYEVREDRGSGRQRVIYIHFKGVALAPSMVVTASGSYPLLAVADLEDADTGSGTPSEEVEAFRRYAARTTFTGRDAAAQELIERWTDADGAYRSDIAYSLLDQVDFSRCALSQQYVRPGARVTIVGTFSSAKGGIVPSGWQAGPRIMVGDPARVMTALGTTARNRLILGLLAATAASGLVAAFVNQ
jgi:hypothetical protein